MRRWIALTLLLQVLLLPGGLLLAASDVDVPVCCRRHGPHHCASAMPAMDDDGGPGLKSGVSCPHRLGQTTGALTPFVAGPQPSTPQLATAGDPQIASLAVAPAMARRTANDRAPPAA